MTKKMEKFSMAGDCPIRDVLDRFGDKWSILVILILGEADGALRFNELKQIIGNISQKMLTVTLRTLTADGLVSRKHYPEIPPRVEYHLTDMGRSLLPHINALADWASRNQSTILKTRKKFSAQRQVA